VAVLLACVQDSDWGDGGLSGSAVAHHPGSRRATFGSVKPRRSSISANVRTTLSAYRSGKVFIQTDTPTSRRTVASLASSLSFTVPKAVDYGCRRVPGR
jgi:hypothetical protein